MHGIIVPGYLNGIPLYRFTPLDVCATFQRNGLSLYTDNIARVGIDGYMLMHMHERDTGRLRITNTQDRKLLFSMINALKTPHVRGIVMRRPAGGSHRRSRSEAPPPLAEEGKGGFVSPPRYRHLLRSKSAPKVVSSPAVSPEQVVVYTPPRSRWGRGEWAERVAQALKGTSGSMQRVLEKAVGATEGEFYLNSAPEIVTPPSPPQPPQSPSTPFRHRFPSANTHALQRTPPLHPKRRASLSRALRPNESPTIWK